MKGLVKDNNEDNEPGKKIKEVIVKLKSRLSLIVNVAKTLTNVREVCVVLRGIFL